jgi:hypothetical protein
MPTDDEAARKARADQLHAQIEAAKRKGASPVAPGQVPAPASASEPPASPPQPESPREFTEWRIREQRAFRKRSPP